MTPWTGFWVRNYFAQAWPWLGAIMFNPYVCGAVSGVGAITALVGFREFVSAFTARRAAQDTPAAPADAPRP